MFSSTSLSETSQDVLIFKPQTISKKSSQFLSTYVISKISILDANIFTLAFQNC